MYIYGKNVVREVLNSNQKVLRAYVSKNSKERDLINQLKSRKIQIHFVDQRVLDGYVDGLHQGFVLEIDEALVYPLEDLFDYDQEKEKPIVVILDHIEDPHNFGAIIRTCEAMGVKGIVIPNDRCVGINGVVVKTSVGAIHHIKIVRIANLGVAIDKLKQHGYWIVGTDMNGTDYHMLDYDVPVALVIGNEGHGMSKVIADSCDYVARIPMYGKVNSLNASVACGMFLSCILYKRSLL